MPLTWHFYRPSMAQTTPCIELIFMVPKVFEPLKFDCTSMILFSYIIEMVIFMFQELYGWTMDAIVKQIGLKNNCMYILFYC